MKEYKRAEGKEKAFLISALNDHWVMEFKRMNMTPDIFYEALEKSIINKNALNI
ncbi:hypothetical protein HK096_010953, partial [Nowakowskiella sp. JEL0078]